MLNIKLITNAQRSESCPRSVLAASISDAMPVNCGPKPKPMMFKMTGVWTWVVLTARSWQRSLH